MIIIRMHPNLKKWDQITTSRIIELEEVLLQTCNSRKRAFIQSLINLNKLIKFEISNLQDENYRIN